MKEQTGEVIPLFSTPVFLSGEKFEITESFLDFIKNVDKTLGEKGSRAHTNSSDYYILEKEEFADLKKFIERQLHIYVHDTLKITTDSTFYITQSWLNFNERGDDHHRHWHQNSLFSGVFYITGDDCPIVFCSAVGDPPFGMGWEFEVKEFNLFNSGEWSIPNEKNGVVLFPSSTLHYVNEYYGIGTRISLSFNTFVKGTLGKGIDKTELKL